MENFDNINKQSILRKRKIVLNDEKKVDMNKFKERFRTLHQRRVKS